MKPDGIVLEQKLGTAAKAVEEVFGAMPHKGLLPSDRLPGGSALGPMAESD
jgi:hypothetical protein